MYCCLVIRCRSGARLWRCLLGLPALEHAILQLPISLPLFPLPPLPSLTPQGWHTDRLFTLAYLPLCMVSLAAAIRWGGGSGRRGGAAGGGAAGEEVQYSDTSKAPHRTVCAMLSAEHCNSLLAILSRQTSRVAARVLLLFHIGRFQTTSLTPTHHCCHCRSLPGHTWNFLAAHPGTPTCCPWPAASGWGTPASHCAWPRCRWCVGACGRACVRKAQGGWVCVCVRVCVRVCRTSLSGLPGAEPLHRLSACPWRRHPLSRGRTADLLGHPAAATPPGAADLLNL